MQTKSNLFVKSNVNQVIKQTAREPNCTIITVSTGKGFSHFLHLLTNKGCDSSLSKRSSSKMAKPVKTPNASEECFEVEMTSINFRSGLYFFSLFLTISIVLIFTPAREALLSYGCLSGFSSHNFPKQKHTSIRSIYIRLKRKNILSYAYLHTSVRKQKHTSIRSHPLFQYIATD